MNRGTLAMHLSPRCGAWGRQAQRPCRNAAMANGRCRLHGGKNPGAPIGNKRALVHGRYSAEGIANRREGIALIETAIALLRQAFRAHVDVARRLRRGELSPEEAERQHKAAKAQTAEAMAVRARGVALKHGFGGASAAAKIIRAEVRTAVKEAEAVTRNRKRRG
jgi:hypothetical protein